MIFDKKSKTQKPFNIKHVLQQKKIMMMEMSDETNTKKIRIYFFQND